MLSLFDILFGREVELVILEDNQATIKVAKAGYSHKLRHMARHARVDIGSIAEVLQWELIH